MERLIGVDIGGTKTRIGAVLNGKILARRDFPTRGLAEICAVIREVLHEVGWEKPDAIGVGAPALVDMHQGRILHAPNLPPYWNGVNVADALEHVFACPVYLGNDANVAALGELVYGWRASDFLYVTWSTGIGAGIVAAGRVIWGAHGRAGEIGHLPLRLDGPKCNCGKYGCLEALAGGAALCARARERLGQDLSAKELVERAKQGDLGSLGLIEEACTAMGQGLAIAAELLDLDMIIIGGGFTASWDFLGPKVMAVLTCFSHARPKAELTKLGDDVGVLGAASLPFHFPFR